MTGCPSPCVPSEWTFLMHVKVGWRAVARAVLPLAAGGIAYVAIPGLPGALHRAIAILT